MHVHILGICGTFMGGIAALAREQGCQVSGQDRAAWPPMSTQLEALGIGVHSGYDAAPLETDPPDLVIVGNAVSRGNPVLEYVLDRGLPYVSGPQWLAEHLLHDRWVLAVAGTHGKTTTASLLAHILEDAGLAPGFLIGGVPGNFGQSARCGQAPFFVIEADEYDTAFCDKRSKFVHYRPRTAVLNNLEFDHADIFADLAAIETQFHHLVRTIPGNGLILHPAQDAALQRVLERGCWTPTLAVGGAQARVVADAADWSAFTVHIGDAHWPVSWPLRGKHNAHNALMAVLAARHAGVPAAQAVEALPRFAGVARRQTLLTEFGGIRVYDDFAHHPTAIRETLVALDPGAGGRLQAVLELRSNSMRAGAHAPQLAAALDSAACVHLYQPPDLPFDAAAVLGPLGPRLRVHHTIDAVLDGVITEAQSGDVIVLMSNGSFGGLPQRIGPALKDHLSA
ncbi:MAG: UDP-N-acetylmuramate:L-alanyl-gamma-D-glutamyl-meso-diaminopimelate ligase [Oceanococcaceae bacterium]